MIKEYDFSKGKWNTDDFMYVYSPVCSEYQKFTQDDDGIRNIYDYDNKDFGHGYVSMVTKEKYKRNIKLSAECSFVKFGAPLIVVSNDIYKDGDILRYDFHYEFVAYEGGCNMWRITHWPERKERPIFTMKPGYVDVPVEAGSKALIEAVIGDTTFDVSINGHSFHHESPEIPESFHVGITACEGENKFYNFKIEQF